MAGLLAQMICHPVKIWLLPQNATVRLTSSPFTMFAFLSLDHVLQDIHTLCHLRRRGTAPHLTAGQLARDRSEGKQLCRAADQSVCSSDPYSHASQPTGGCHVEFSSYHLYAITYLAGSTPKGLSIFRNGNAMCENYEVSEVWGLAEEGTNVTVLLVFWDNLV